MPQLSPMLGFLMSICTLSGLLLLMVSLKRSYPKVSTSKLTKSSTPSFPVF